MDVATLAELLRETAEHHGHYEKTHPEHNWWDWYAPYIHARQQEVPRPTQPLPPIFTWKSSEMLLRADSARI